MKFVRPQSVTHGRNIFRHGGRVGSVKEGRALILDVVDLDEDVGRRAEGLLRVGWVVSGLDHHVVGRSEIKVRYAKLTLLSKTRLLDTLTHFFSRLGI